MPEEMRMIVFTITGETETESWNIGNAPVDNGDDEIVSFLNKNSNVITLDIQRVMAGHIRSAAGVVAEVRFSKGTILVEGTVILSFVAPFAIAIGKKVVDVGITKLVETVVSRVINHHMNRFNPNLSTRPMRVTARGEIATSDEAADNLHETQRQRSAAPEEVSVRMPLPMWILLVGNTALLVILTIILLLAIFLEPQS